MEGEELGLTTREALLKLYVEIDTVLQQYKTSLRLRKSKSWIRDTLDYTSLHTTINCIYIVFLLWSAFSLILSFVVEENDEKHPEMLLYACVVLFLLGICLALEFYDNKLRHYEVPNRVQRVLDKIKEETGRIEWGRENYPHIYTPMSPCITLQWTFRDGHLVNLPWSLLVKDDVILVKPGQFSPGYCEALDKNAEHPLLHAKEVFAPTLQSANEIFSAPKLRKPMGNKKYKLLETPYLNNLRVFLEQSLERPKSQINQQRFLVMIQTIERILLPVIFSLSFLTSLFRWWYPLAPPAGFTAAFFVVPVNTVLPMLPLVFPIAWNLLNYLGMARFKTIFDTSRRIKPKLNLLEDEGDETATVESTEMCLRHCDIWRNFILIARGTPEIVTHSTNIVHVLGSVTALGCVDKKGILSWPNPTAEKVFFLHNNDNISPASSLGNVGDLAADGDSAGGTPHHYLFDVPLATATAEVLDLTHTFSDPFQLHFDDPDWHRHLTSLKPLGLAILLNTCNYDTQEQYSSFCSHISCEATYNESLVPVTNRRCLCELAKEIGFVDQAQKIFSLEQLLSTYRHLQPEMVRRDNKYARSLHLSTKLKFPFPHQFAVVVKELSSGAMQLLSEGTADLIIDSCVDYWDGHDLCPFSPGDKKKVQDFYQRSSLTAYCTAFAYRPLNKTISNKLSDVYLELPSDSRHLYMNYRSPTPVHWDCKSVLEPKIRTPLGQFYSTDSLLYNDCPTVDVSDADSCFQIQCNQVFIGMVTMQYQPLTDMVQLIEQLERACIRFVHFSKENELRSRVFSEKMGLESGWNCHISLLSERNRGDSSALQSDKIAGATCRLDGRERRLSQSARKLLHYDENTSYVVSNSNLESSRTMSFSAPSAINMEHSIVKFESESETIVKIGEQSGKIASHDSVQLHDWQSLSCLTDSTEQSAPINFDMSNRAKLPRGIDKIRPHIELIDNVPLLVSLFTDCTPSATREMLQIMQDYGEVVCILGSAANTENVGIFMQADASIAIHPLYPQVCQRMQVYENPQTCISPADLSNALNSVPCSLSVKREDSISFYHLIMESRHFCLCLWNCVQFWLSCSVILSLMQLTSSVFLLPLLLTTGHVLWFATVVIPVLSVSLMALPVDQNLMKKPQAKKINGSNMTDTLIFIVWCYGLKFCPTLLAVLVSYLGILTAHCRDFCVPNNCTCDYFYMPSGGHLWADDSWTLQTSRMVIVFIILLHFVILSIGFVHRDSLIYRKLPIRNYLWLITVFTLVVIQSLYTILGYYSLTGDFEEDLKYETPVWVIIFAAVSPFLVLVINELVKQQEIRVNKRFMKRARLDFGTKLGMNSPF